MSTSTSTATTAPVTASSASTNITGKSVDELSPDTMNFQENTMAHITQLQNQEKQYYGQLNDVSLSPEAKARIVAKINELAQVRTNLYDSLKQTYNTFRSNSTATQQALNQQMIAIAILEEELNEAKKRAYKVEDETVQKMRQITINTYYSKRYQAQIDFIKTALIFCVPAIILVVLGNKGILPFPIVLAVIGLLVFFAIFKLGKKWLDIMNRDNMNYDRYNWYFDVSKAPTATESSTSSDSRNPWNVDYSTCVGEACCATGMTYDTTLNKCVM